MIKEETRAKIKGYLEGFIEGLISEHETHDLRPTDIRPSRAYSAKADIKPFHEALLPDGVLTITEFERSFSTKLGSTFEETARIIGEQVFAEARRSYRIRGKIAPETVRKIESIANQIGTEGMKTSYLDLIDQVVRINGEQTVERERIADLYLRDREGSEFFIEIKSPKPNKGQCIEVADRLLQIHAIKRATPPKVKTFYAMAYNPYGEQKSTYKHSLAVHYLDLTNQVLIGREFWELVGGKGTYESVLEIYREVGKEKGPDMIEKLALT